MKNRREKSQKNEKKVQKDKQMLDVSSVKSWVIMQMNAGMRKTQVGMMTCLLAMTCYENSKEEKCDNGEEENKQE